MIDGWIEMLKIAFRLLIMIPIMFAFVAIMGILVQLIYSFSTEGLIADIFAVIQIWLPFDFSVIMMYAMTTGLLYVTYRVAYKMYEFANSVLGKS